MTPTAAEVDKLEKFFKSAVLPTTEVITKTCHWFSYGAVTKYLENLKSGRMQKLSLQTYYDRLTELKQFLETKK